MAGTAVSYLWVVPCAGAILAGLVLAIFLYQTLRIRSIRNEISGAVRWEGEDLVTGNEYSATVFRAYRQLAKSLKKYGYLRRDSETLRQFALAIGRAMPSLDSAAVIDFTKVVEEARYSNHTLGEAARQRAIRDLVRVKVSLDRIILTEEQFLQIAASHPEEGFEQRIVVGRTSFEAQATPSSGAQAAEENPGFLVVDPHPFPHPPPAGGPGRKPFVRPRHDGSDEVLRRFRDSMLPPGGTAASPSGLVEVLGGSDWSAMAKVLPAAREKRVKPPATHVSPALVAFLFEFAHRLADRGELSIPLDDAALLGILRSSALLAHAEGRDYLIPDDLKVACMVTWSREFRSKRGLPDTIAIARETFDEELHVFHPPSAGGSTRFDRTVHGIPVPAL